MLKQLLDQLNALVKEHNAEIDELVANHVHTKEKGDALKWPTEITRETLAGINTWNELPAAFLNIVQTKHTHMHAQQFLKLVRSIPKDKLSRCAKELWRGAFNGKGGQDPDYELPATFLMYQLAHVAACATPAVAEKAELSDLHALMEERRAAAEG